MASYQILYWQEIPSQIKVIEDIEEHIVPLDPCFMEWIDHTAAQRGCENEEDYLAGWHWGERMEKEGSMAEVAEEVKKELETQFTFEPPLP